MATAIITGGSKGLGRALARALHDLGWRVVVDGRGAPALDRLAAELPGVVTVAGDVTDPAHRRALVDAAAGPVDLLVNNASTLGPTPLPGLDRLDPDDLRRILDVNVVAPLALVQAVLPRLAPGGRIVNVTSDAAVEAYPGWGGYGAAKAALDHLGRILAVEHPDVPVHSVDPGDMRTELHQAAFPGEDISDRPPPEDSVPGVLVLVLGDHPSGRHLARQLVTAGPGGRDAA